MKTSDLIGAALDWAVAKAEGHRWRDAPICQQYSPDGCDCWMPWQPSTKWAQGGPIIEREGIAIRKHSSGKWYAKLSRNLGDSEGARWNLGQWAGYETFEQTRFDGPTPLIAAMRCYVASKLGDEVDIPEELS